MNHRKLDYLLGKRFISLKELNLLHKIKLNQIKLVSKSPHKDLSIQTSKWLHEISYLNSVKRKENLLNSNRKIKIDLKNVKRLVIATNKDFNINI